MLQDINVKFYRYSFQKGYVPPDVRLIQKLEELIEQYFKVHKDAAFYCNTLKITERMMNSHLKFHKNVTVFQFVQLRVYQEAESLLLFTNMTIQQISHELGIPDAGYFTRIFKKAYGITPKKYRIYSLKELSLIKYTM